jgi:hypothetical protein
MLMKTRNSIQAVASLLALIICNTQLFSQGLEGPEGEDLFANAAVLDGTLITTLPTDLFTKGFEPFEPSHRANGDSAGKTAWWQWTAPHSGWCSIDTLTISSTNPMRDTVLAVYTGPAINNLTTIATNDDAFVPNAPTTLSQVTFRATAGVTYKIAVDSKSFSTVSDTLRNVILKLAFLSDQKNRYMGYIIPSDQTSILNSFINLSKARTHSFSGNINLRGTTYRFKGLIPDTNTCMVILRLKNDPSPLVLHLVFGDRGVTTAAVKDNQTIGGQVFRVLPPSELPPLPETYNGITQLSGLTGYGAFSIRLRKSGSFSSAWVMPDGTAFASGGAVLQGEPSTFAAVYRPLFKKQGHVLCLFQMADALIASTAGTFHRPPNATGSFMPAEIKSFIVGAIFRYVVPGSGRLFPAYDLVDGNATVLLDEILNPANPIPPVSTPTELSTRNRFVFADKTFKPKLSLNLRTGMVTGKLQPEPGKPAVTIRAAATPEILPNVHFLGHFRSRTDTARFRIQHAIP